MTDTFRLGEVLREGERLGLRYVRRLEHSPKKVWRALTESPHLRHWMPCDLVGERHAGAALVARFWPDFVSKYKIPDPDLPASIRVWDPPRVFEWTWDTDVLRWELEPAEGGTLLTFTTFIDTREVPAHKTAAGYHACLDRLAELLDRGAVTVPLVHAAVEALEATYERLAAAADGRG
jgi:uncharacterized protein YndB with AHSA1/START domain